MSSDTKLGGAEVRLANEFAGVFSRETVAEVLHDSFDQLAATAKVRTYLELFAERFARERLAAVAQSQAGVPGGPPEVLFVCVLNARRRARGAHVHSPLGPLSSKPAAIWERPAILSG